MTQALEAGLASFADFDLQPRSARFGYSLLTASNAISPDGLLYGTVLPYLGSSGKIANTSIRVAVANVGSVMLYTQGANKSEFNLLVVNVNLTEAIDVGLNNLFPTSPPVSGKVVTWNDTAGAPTVKSVTPFSRSYTIPLDGMLLLNASCYRCILSGPNLGVPPSSELGASRGPRGSESHDGLAQSGAQPAVTFPEGAPAPRGARSPR